MVQRQLKVHDKNLCHFWSVTLGGGHLGDVATAFWRLFEFSYSYTLRFSGSRSLISKIRPRRHFFGNVSLFCSLHNIQPGTYFIPNTYLAHIPHGSKLSILQNILFIFFSSSYLYFIVDYEQKGSRLRFANGRSLLIVAALELRFFLHSR